MYVIFTRGVKITYMSRESDHALHTHCPAFFAPQSEKCRTREGTYHAAAGLCIAHPYAGGATTRTHTGDGTLAICSVAINPPVAWSIRKVTTVSVS